MNLTEWLDDIEAQPDTIDTDRAVAEFLAQEPERLWSLHDVLHGLHHEILLADLRDSVRSLIGGGHLTEVVDLGCDEHRDGFWGDECADPLCGDSMFQIPASWPSNLN